MQNSVPVTFIKKWLRMCHFRFALHVSDSRYMCEIHVLCVRFALRVSDSRYVCQIRVTCVKFALHVFVLQVPLKYLIGALHIKFKLLWEPITKLIASHAVGLDKTVFWDLYRQILQDTAKKCGKN